MLLTADIGNTNIVLALLDHGDRVVSQRRIPSGEVLPLAAYEDAVRQVLAGHDAPEGGRHRLGGAPADGGNGPGHPKCYGAGGPGGGSHYPGGAGDRH